MLHCWLLKDTRILTYIGSSLLLSKNYITECTLTLGYGQALGACQNVINSDTSCNLACAVRFIRSAHIFSYWCDCGQVWINDYNFFRITRDDSLCFLQTRSIEYVYNDGWTGNSNLCKWHHSRHWSCLRKRFVLFMSNIYILSFRIFFPIGMGEGREYEHFLTATLHVFITLIHRRMYSTKSWLWSGFRHLYCNKRQWVSMWHVMQNQFHWHG